MTVNLPGVGRARNLVGTLRGALRVGRDHCHVVAGFRCDLGQCESHGAGADDDQAHGASGRVQGCMKRASGARPVARDRIRSRGHQPAGMNHPPGGCRTGSGIPVTPGRVVYPECTVNRQHPGTRP